MFLFFDQTIMVHNIEFIVCCVQSLKFFNVLIVGQKYFGNWLVELCSKIFFTLKDWYIVIFTLEVESA
jgi:hypothetical protein